MKNDFVFMLRYRWERVAPPKKKKGESLETSYKKHIIIIRTNFCAKDLLL